MLIAQVGSLGQRVGLPPLGGPCSKLRADGTITSAVMRRRWNQLREANDSNLFLLGITAFVVVGTKPGDG